MTRRLLLLIFAALCVNGYFNAEAAQDRRESSNNAYFTRFSVLL
jgi:hypothetical protein